jgi:hypothetical protein
MLNGLNVLNVLADRHQQTACDIVRGFTEFVLLVGVSKQIAVKQKDTKRKISKSVRK